MKRPLLFILFISSLFLPGYSNASCAPNSESPSERKTLVHSVGISAGVDFVASSMRDELLDPVDPVDKVNVNSAVPVSLRYSFSFTDPTIAHYLPGGYQGISVGVINFGAAQPNGFSRASRNIGYPVVAYIFQGGPFHHFSSRLSLDYEWNFGAAFGWKPYSDSNSRFNIMVGSRVNAYLNLGLTLKWQLNPRTGIFGGIAVSHFSNGNTSFPNPGVNSFGLRVGMVYTLNPPADGYKPAGADTTRYRRLEYDFSLWGATRKRVYKGGEMPVLLKGHFACAGISFAPMYSFNSWWRAGGSLDVQWDRSSDMKKNYISGTTTSDIRFTSPNFFRQMSVGISAHGELRMPVFAVNIGCGYNIVAPWENRGSYQNITLKTYLYRGLFLNIGYQLRNFHQQSSLMLGAGLTV